jgi:hypothetical protein
VPSSVLTDAATIVPLGSTTATLSYSDERAAAATSAARAASLASGSVRFCPKRTTSGSFPTRTMSPRRLCRYASIALAVEVERCSMFVTPSAVRSPRVLWIETADTSAIGTTPTTSSAAKTLCQKRGRRNDISPALYAPAGPKARSATLRTRRQARESPEWVPLVPKEG